MPRRLIARRPDVSPCTTWGAAAPGHPPDAKGRPSIWTPEKEGRALIHGEPSENGAQSSRGSVDGARAGIRSTWSPTTGAWGPSTFVVHRLACGAWSVRARSHRPRGVRRAVLTGTDRGLRCDACLGLRPVGRIPSLRWSRAVGAVSRQISGSPLPSAGRGGAMVRASSFPTAHNAQDVCSAIALGRHSSARRTASFRRTRTAPDDFRASLVGLDIAPVPRTSGNS